MSAAFLKLTVGLPLGSQEDLALIPNASAEVLAHIVLKTMQLGTILGTAVAALVAVLARPGPRTPGALGAAAARFGPAGAALGVPLGLLMYAARLRGVSGDPIYDRAYRLRRNDNQHRADRAYLGGATLGAAVGFASRLGVAGGACAVSVAGLLLAALYNARLAKAAAAANHK
eukprot:EG_transcript_20504